MREENCTNENSGRILPEFLRPESGRMDGKACLDRHSDIRQAYIVGKEINHE